MQRTDYFPDTDFSSMNRLLFVGLACLLMVGLMACEDAATVGVDLVGEQGEPMVTRLITSRFETEQIEDVTGGTSRVLAGSVDDPLLGSLSAIGYMDFTGPFGSPDDSTLIAANILLQPNYVYGDTLLTLSLSITEVLEDWAEAGGTADTTLPIEAMPLTTFDFAASDSLLTIPLPESWITQYEGDIRGATFTDAFHGFALQTMASSAVVGFSRVSADLQLITPTDTILYPATKSLSSISRSNEPVLPPDRVVIQDGVGASVKFAFDFTDVLEEPLNGAYVRVFADSSQIQDTPANFVRPLLRDVFLQAMALTDEGEEVVLISVSGSLDEHGNLRFSSNAMRTLLQGAFFEPDLFDHFRLFPPGDANSINPLLIHTPTSTDKEPEALLTLSPSGR